MYPSFNIYQVSSEQVCRYGILLYPVYLIYNKNSFTNFLYTYDILQVQYSFLAKVRAAARTAYFDENLKPEGFSE
jgi:hypothetical protein